MTREELKDILPIVQAFVKGKKIEFRNNIGFVENWKEVEEIPGLAINCYEYRIKPEVTSSPSTLEYHYECFDNGCTLAGEDIKMCAIGDDDSKKTLGELILADIIHHCNLTCSNKVKITVKIESED